MVSIPLSLAIGIAGAVFPRLLAEPDLDRRLRGRARPAGRRLDRRGREHRAPPAHGLRPRCRPRSPARGRSCVAILGCTATLIFAFLPLMALPGNAGKFIRVLPTTVIATIVGSLVIALFIIPFLASRVLPSRPEPSTSSALLDRLMGAHPPLLPPGAALLPGAAARHRRRRDRRLAAADRAAGAAARQQPVPQGRYAAVPGHGADAERHQPRRAPTARCASSRRRWRRRPRCARSSPTSATATRRSTTTTSCATTPPNYAELFVLLQGATTRAARRSCSTSCAPSRCSAIPARASSVKEFINGIPISAPIAVRVIGPDLDTLEPLAEQVEQLLESTPGTRDVNNPLRVPRTNLRLQRRSAEGRAARRAHGRVRPRRAAGGLRPRSRHVQEPRRRAVRHRGAHAGRRARRRSTRCSRCRCRRRAARCCRCRSWRRWCSSARRSLIQRFGRERAVDDRRAMSSAA